MESINDVIKKYKNSKQDIVLMGADFISQKGYTLVPNYILYTDKINAYGKLVYAMLLSYAWNKGAVFPGQELLAKECGISPRSVFTALKDLENNEFISIVRRGLGKTNIYILHFRKR